MIKTCPRCEQTVNAYCQGMLNGRSFTCPECQYWGGHTKWNEPERFRNTGEYKW